LTLILTAVSGVASASFVVSWLLSVKSGAYMMVEVFLLLGVTVPILLCNLFFEEEITIVEIFGILLLLLSVFIMCTYNTGIKGKIKPSALLLLIVCGLSNGIADFTQKAFSVKVNNGSPAVFNFYTYVFAAATLLIAYFIFRVPDKKSATPPRNPIKVVNPIWIYVVIMAGCLFANSFFKTKAAYYLDSTQLYPLNQGGSVILSLLMSALIFKEKINGKCIVGICLAFISLLMINLDFGAIFG
jgi:drug/metabolite transporter (DMT)-like permease